MWFVDDILDFKFHCKHKDLTSDPVAVCDQGDIIFKVITLHCK